MRIIIDTTGLLSKYQATFEDLAQSGHISPISSMDAVSIGQVAEYLGLTVKDLQAARQRLKKDLDKLGMFTLTAREVGAVVPGPCGIQMGSMTYH